MNIRNHFTLGAIAAALAVVVGCSSAVSPDRQGGTGSPGPKSGQYQEAIFDFYIGDLNDPAVLAKYSRVDLLITDPSRFWGKAQYEGDIALLKSVNPDIKVVGFFRSKCIREEWSDESRTRNTYLTALYEASLPYWASTTTGDTARDWPGVILYDPADAAARKAQRDVFVEHQRTSVNKLDGVYWDYFNDELWIAPDVAGMSGDPDLDGDGVGHWEDADEKADFKASSRAHVLEMRAELGDDFIQIANGWQGLRDSTFAALLDGMFYELFPDVGFTSGARYAESLDLDVPYNLFAAAKWPRTRNGGPWLILSNKRPAYTFRDGSGSTQPLNLGDVNRAFALLADCTSVHYDLSGRHAAGVPAVQLDLGAPLGPAAVDGNIYSRAYSNGSVTVTLNGPTGLFPVSYSIEQNGSLVQALDVPTIYP